ncbi:MAG TPA: type II secretion system F family protein [Gemmatimonadales bacterium]|jgi:tight adherence protein C
MLAIVLICVAASAAFVLLFIMEVAPGRNPLMAQRLSEMQAADQDAPATLERRRRQARGERLKGVLQAFGEAVQERSQNTSAVRLRLVQAGYPNAAAVPMYLGLRVAVPALMGMGTALLLPTLGYSAPKTLIMSIYFGIMGYVLPSMMVGRRLKRRQKEMQKALPDALDMLVVSVEAGLGLNQALVRVSEEIYRISPVLSEQLALVNLEIRAGTTREEALRNLAERTGLQDISSLVGMLIQTDRFGTSVAQALRVHSETMRTKRRQRAEEAAAKTTIKMVFPLVFCIFPALFVVILGPALIQIYKALSGFGG